jgi:hypothetical protein
LFDFFGRVSWGGEGRGKGGGRRRRRREEGGGRREKGEGGRRREGRKRENERKGGGRRREGREKGGRATGKKLLTCGSVITLGKGILDFLDLVKHGVLLLNFRIYQNLAPEKKNCDEPVIFLFWEIPHTKKTQKKKKWAGVYFFQKKKTGVDRFTFFGDFLFRCGQGGRLGGQLLVLEANGIHEDRELRIFFFDDGEDVRQSGLEFVDLFGGGSGEVLRARKGEGWEEGGVVEEGRRGEGVEGWRGGGVERWRGEEEGKGRPRDRSRSSEREDG